MVPERVNVAAMFDPGQIPCSRRRVSVLGALTFFIVTFFHQLVEKRFGFGTGFFPGGFEGGGYPGGVGPVGARGGVGIPLPGPGEGHQESPR